MERNVRIVSRDLRTEAGYWFVRPSEADARMPAIWRELDAYRDAEPGMNWTLEVRGEDSDWHEHEAARELPNAPVHPVVFVLPKIR